MTHPNFAKFDNAFLDALERPVHLGLKLAERHDLRLTFVERLLSLLHARWARIPGFREKMRTPDWLLCASVERSATRQRCNGSRESHRLPAGSGRSEGTPVSQSENSQP